jgi:chromatin remodeling complex protein RSC6
MRTKSKPKAKSAPTRRRATSAGTQARGRRGAATAKRRGVGLQQPVRPDAALAEVIGPTPAPRTELTRRMWDYIKAHRLQDPDDRRMIRPDTKLQKVVGAKQKVSMFELAKHLNAHVS